MLEPLLRRDLPCAGCAKIQYPAHVLKKNLTPEECFRAVEECGAPVVSIPGGEPLIIRRSPKSSTGWSRAKSTLPFHQCAAAERSRSEFTPSKYFRFPSTWTASASTTIFRLPRGTYDKAVEGIRGAPARLPRHHEYDAFRGRGPESVRQFFDEMMELGVEGMMLSPGYTYDKAPDQQHFLCQEKDAQPIPPNSE